MKKSSDNKDGASVGRNTLFSRQSSHLLGNSTWARGIKAFLETPHVRGHRVVMIGHSSGATAAYECHISFTSAAALISGPQHVLDETVPQLPPALRRDHPRRAAAH